MDIACSSGQNAIHFAYKPLISPPQDFFYVCPAHLQDRHFCSPIIDTEDQAARAKEEAIAKEIENIKKEYEEKQRRKKVREKKSSKDDKEEKDTSKDESQSKDKSKDLDTNDEKERDEKVCVCKFYMVVLADSDRSILFRRALEQRRKQMIRLEFLLCISMGFEQPFDYYLTFDI
jgi:hypothetical protein